MNRNSRAVIVLIGSFAALAFTVVASRAQAVENGEKLVQASDCSSCHALDRQLVGPSYSAMAKRYAGQVDAPQKLSERIAKGGSGNWGAIAMTPHPDIKDAQRLEMVNWILSVKSASEAAPQSAPKSYSYEAKDGTKIELDFPLFVDGGKKVTKDVFRGYQQYNSYCFRCHGQDVTGGQLAPDLRHSLNSSMKQSDFISITMAGRADKGMPSWAGFFSEDEVIKIYRYVKGRSVNLISGGRPPSESD